MNAVTQVGAAPSDKGLVRIMFFVLGFLTPGALIQTYLFLDMPGFAVAGLLPLLVAFVLVLRAHTKLPQRGDGKQATGKQATFGFSAGLATGLLVAFTLFILRSLAFVSALIVLQVVVLLTLTYFVGHALVAHHPPR